MSCSVHDGVELEKRGIPSVAIHTSAFTGSAVAHAVAYGRPDYEPAIVRHPIAGLTPAEVNERADEILPKIVSILLGKGNVATTPASNGTNAADESKDAVSAALAVLRSGFNADGADLEVEAVGADSATVRLVVTQETCLECIVSKAVLQQIVETTVRSACPHIRTVELIDPREAVVG